MTLKCPACADNRLHTIREWREFHPLAGHGYQEGQGWSTPELDPAGQPDELLEPVAS